MTIPNRFGRRWFAVDQRTDRPDVEPDSPRNSQGERDGTSQDVDAMIVEMGHRVMACGLDHSLARYTSHAVHTECVAMHGESISTTRRVFVEILQRISGHPQRAMLGGTLSPGTNQLLEVVLHVSEDRPLGAAATYPGAFRHDLVPGLPEEFIEWIPRALMTQIARPGVITIDRAAYDEVESSVHGFSLAADLLGLVVSYESLAEAEGAIRQRLTEW